MERREFLRASAGGLAVLGASAVVSGCAGAAAGAAAEAAFNPAVTTWLADLAQSVGASVLTDYLKTGVEKTVGYFHDWLDGVSKQADNYNYIWSDCYGHEIPPVVLVQVSSKKSEYGDPMVDGLLACVNGGHSAVYFKPWAWQALSMYVHDMTTGLSGQGLANAQRVCVTGLVPSGTRPLTGQSPERVVEWMTYESRGGPVELAKLEGSGSQYLATVKATGIWGANQQPLVKQYALPNQAAPTDN